MTRYARAQGSKSCNARLSADPTPWSEMVSPQTNKRPSSSVDDDVSTPKRERKTPAKKTPKIVKLEGTPKSPGATNGGISSATPAASQSAKKVSNKTPLKPKGLDFSNTPSSAKSPQAGKLSEPSPLMTRSARKKKAELNAALGTPSATTVSPKVTRRKSLPAKAATPKAQKATPKGTPKGRRSISKNLEKEDERDSDDLDSDDNVGGNDSDDIPSEEEVVDEEQAERLKLELENLVNRPATRKSILKVHNQTPVKAKVNTPAKTTENKPIVEQIEVSPPGSEPSLAAVGETEEVSKKAEAKTPAKTPARTPRKTKGVTPAKPIKSEPINDENEVEAQEVMPAAPIKTEPLSEQSDVPAESLTPNETQAKSPTKAKVLTPSKMQVASPDKANIPTESAKKTPSKGMASNTPLKSPQSNGSLELKTAAISSPVSAATGTPKTPVQSAALTPNTTPNSLKKGKRQSAGGDNSSTKKARLSKDPQEEQHSVTGENVKLEIMSPVKAELMKPDENKSVVETPGKRNETPRKTLAKAQLESNTPRSEDESKILTPKTEQITSPLSKSALKRQKKAAREAEAKNLQSPGVAAGVAVDSESITEKTPGKNVQTPTEVQKESITPGKQDESPTMTPKTEPITSPLSKSALKRQRKATREAEAKLLSPGVAAGVAVDSESITEKTPGKNVQTPTKVQKESITPGKQDESHTATPKTEQNTTPLSKSALKRQRKATREAEAKLLSPGAATASGTSTTEKTSENESSSLATEVDNSVTDEPKNKTPKKDNGTPAKIQTESTTPGKQDDSKTATPEKEQVSTPLSKSALKKQRKAAREAEAKKLQSPEATASETTTVIASQDSESTTEKEAEKKLTSSVENLVSETTPNAKKAKKQKLPQNGEKAVAEVKPQEVEQLKTEAAGDSLSKREKWKLKKAAAKARQASEQAVDSKASTDNATEVPIAKKVKKQKLPKDGEKAVALVKPQQVEQLKTEAAGDSLSKREKWKLKKAAAKARQASEEATDSKASTDNATEVPIAKKVKKQKMRKEGEQKAEEKSEEQVQKAETEIVAPTTDAAVEKKKKKKKNQGAEISNENHAQKQLSNSTAVNSNKSSTVSDETPVVNSDSIKVEKKMKKKKRQAEEETTTNDNEVQNEPSGPKKKTISVDASQTVDKKANNNKKANQLKVEKSTTEGAEKSDTPDNKTVASESSILLAKQLLKEKKRLRKKERKEAKALEKKKALENQNGDSAENVKFPKKQKLAGVKEGSEMHVAAREKLVATGKTEEQIQEQLPKIMRVIDNKLRKVQCLRCRKMGHLQKDCHLSRDKGPQKCYKCGELDHTSRNCSIKEEVFTFAQCFICHQTGHLTRSCPSNPNGIFPKGGACFKCGDKTHVSRNCPKENANVDENTKPKEQQQKTFVGLLDRKQSGDADIDTGADKSLQIKKFPRKKQIVKF